MFEMRNSKTITVKMTRRDLCDVLMSLTHTHIDSGAEKWKKLHDKLKEILDAFDEKIDIAEK